MSKLVFIVLSFVLPPSFSMATELEAWFDYKVFYSPESGSYVETQVNFTGKSLSYNSLSDSTSQAKVLTTIILRNGEDIVDFRKISIDGPVVNNSDLVDFLDIQRFAIPQNGNYIFEIELEDLNDPLSTIQNMNQEFTVAHNENEAFVSDITFVKAYAPANEPTELSKSGYDIVPYINNYFPSAFDAIIFYAEVYNTHKMFGDKGKFALSTSIRNKSGDVVGNHQNIRRKKAAPVLPILQTINISDLRTGDYQLVIEIRDQNNLPVAFKSLSFFRNKFVENPTNKELALINVNKTFAKQYMDRDELMEHIYSLHPISTNLERITSQNQLTSADLILLQQYFYHFWAKRNSENPEASWREYEQEVIKAQAAFGTRIKKGYETDRGRVYLQYGPPNTRVRRHHTNEVFPYEIWHYYEIANQHDKRFLFYDDTAVLEDFELLHSDVQGEIQNQAWRVLMRGRSGMSVGNIQQQQLNKHNRNSYDFEELETLYYNPR